jgi:hypothetical protein
MNASLFGLIFCLVAASHSQSAISVRAQPASSSAQETDELTEKQKLDLLDEILADEMSLKLILNRATVGAAVANLLWDSDPSKARSLVTTVTAQLAAQASRIDPGDSQYYRINEQVTSARRAAAVLIARHDPKLAISFLRATRPPEGSQQVPAPGQIDAESQLELSLLSEYGLADPATALALAEESLAKGISYQIFNLYLKLVSQDPDGAARLAREIVEKLRTTDLVTNPEAGTVTTNFIGYGWREADRARLKGSTNTVQPATFETENLVSLLEIAANAAVSISRPSEKNYPAWQLLRQLKGLMPAFEKYLPSKVPQLRAKLSQFEAMQDDQTTTWDRYQGMMQAQPTTANLLEFLGTVPAPQRDQFYSMIAFQVLDRGDAEQAQQIISEHVTNPVQRIQSLRELNQQRAVKAVAKGSIQDVRIFLDGMPSNEDRFALLLRCASEATGRSDSSGARQFLDEARRLSSRSESGTDLNRRLELAERYSEMDVNVTAEIIEGIFAQLNGLISAASVLDGFEQRGSFQDDEIVIVNSNSWVTWLGRCGRSLAMVARKDAKRASLAIGILQRPEARIAVRMAMLNGLQY